MNKEKIKPILISTTLALIFAASIFALASKTSAEVRISTKSPADFKETTKKIISSLPSSEQTQFREAFVILVRSKVSSEKEIEAIIENPPQYLNGLTASDVLSEGRKIASICANSGECPGVLLESKHR